MEVLHSDIPDCNLSVVQVIPYQDNKDHLRFVNGSEKYFTGKCVLNWLHTVKDIN